MIFQTCKYGKDVSGFSYRGIILPRSLKMLSGGTLIVCVTLITFLAVIMAEAQEEGVSEFSKSEFASKLYDVLKKTPGNVFFSPYSLQVALAMTYTGATGNTAKELQKCLSFPENKEALFKSVKNSTTTLKSGKNVTLNVANGMFLQKDYAIKDSFTKALKTVYEAEAKGLDFAKREESAKEINGYVNKNTNGKIKELFTPDAFNEMTRLVLVNAVYFKGNWVNKFDPSVTFKGDFHLNSKDKVTVDYMKITKKFNTCESDELKATIVELPYEGDFSMVLIVPQEIEGIKHVEATLPKMKLETLTNQAFSREVQLTMPKFKLEQKMELADPLKQMGVTEMFDIGKADFKEISDKRDLYVSKVVQKAFIEVNEEGSEAAAATGIQIMSFSLPLPPTPLVVDRPFVFYIYHVPSDVTLFFGRVSEFR